MQNDWRMKHQNLQIRTKQFALEVIKFSERLPKDETSRILARQLLRSGTSVGANYRAACRAKSKPAFISKLGDVLEEADESGFWVEPLVDSGKVDQQTAADLLTEANALVAIAISSINTAKRNSGAKQSPRLIGKLWAGRIMHYALCILHLNRSRPMPFQQRTNTSCYLAIPTHGFTVVLSVFRGTPPAKPLKCKSVSNRLGARFRQRWTESTGGKPRLSCA